jgi:hypothetical protein
LHPLESITFTAHSQATIRCRRADLRTQSGQHLQPDAAGSQIFDRDVIARRYSYADIYLNFRDCSNGSASSLRA